MTHTEHGGHLLQTKIKHFLVPLLLCLPAFAATYNVKTTGSNSNTCVQAQSASTPKLTVAAGVACLAAGDTLVVFAGTYNENVTVTAGTAGNYKTVTVNGSDIVQVNSFTLNSHTKLIGNCTAPASTASCGFSLGTRTTTSIAAACVTVPDAATDVYIKNNVMYGCGGTGGTGSGIIWAQGATGVSYLYVQGNTLSYGCGTPTSPANCVAIGFNGNHGLFENNDMAHFGLAIEAYAQFTVIRNNNFHDMNESECFGAPTCSGVSGNGHLDIIYAERANAVAQYLVQYQLWEGNTANSITGPDGKGLWTSGNETAANPTTTGCQTLCFNVIGRYNALAHFGSGTAAQTSGVLNVKYYNNTSLDPGMNVHGSTTTDHYRDGPSTGGAEINNLFYYPFSVASTSWGWYAYTQNDSGSVPGFTAGGNLAYCSTSPCSIQTNRAGSVHLFAADSPVTKSNILASTNPLANYAGGDYRLVAGSPAIAAGTYLTTVAAGDSGSGTSLIVNDAGFFQDGLGLTGVGVQPDCIAVNTAANHVCITAVNYATNTLTLASTITRSAGQAVHLYSKSDGTRVLTGTAPDIGAYPFQGASSFSISGTVSPATGSTQPTNVSIACSPCTPSQTPLTGQSTSYSFTSLTSGTSYTVTPTQSTYTFSPACSGTISSNVTCNFTATGTASPTLQPLSDFGSQGIGITSAAKNPSLVNITGTGPLTGVAISIAGTNPGDFAIASTACGATLNAGAACAINVTFTPTASGVRSATLQASYIGGSLSQPLSGTGYQPPVPSCSPTGGTYKSGRMIICSNAVPAATMCWNPGSAPTTNGAGTCTSGTTYSGPFMISDTALLYVTGTQAGNTDNAVNYQFTISGGPWTSGWLMNMPVFGSTKIGAQSLYGPPTYLGSTTSTVVGTIPSAPSMPSINSTAYAYSAPGDLYRPSSGIGNCYTALTDSTDRAGHSFGASWSGGGANVMWDVNDEYGAIQDIEAGSTNYFHVHYDANGCMVRESQALTSSPSGGSGNGGFTFSLVTPARAYKVDGASHSPTATQLWQENLGVDPITKNVTVSRVMLFDWKNCPGVPSGAISQGGNGNLNVSSDDNIFSTSLNIKVSAGVPPNGQDSAHWALAWNRTTGACTSYYSGLMGNTESPSLSGNVWGWCVGDCSQSGSNPAPIGQNTLCDPTGFGIHGNRALNNGLYIGLSGKCDPAQANNSTYWKIGYGNTALKDFQTCNSNLYNCGGHAAGSYSTLWSANNNYAYRHVDNISSFQVIRAVFGGGEDQHCGVVGRGPAGDTGPLVCSQQRANPAVPCTGSLYCDELVAIHLDGSVTRFGPNWHIPTDSGDLGPIPSMQQSGRCISFQSSWGGTRGLAADGVTLRTDLFAICNLQ